jgi:hypothetical protein
MERSGLDLPKVAWAGMAAPMVESIEKNDWAMLQQAFVCGRRPCL